MASRRYINQLGEQENVNDIFLLVEKQLRPNKNGNLYLLMRLADRSGNVNAMMWNASDRSGREINVGDYVQVEGSTQHYNGNLQVIVNRIEPAEPCSINEEELLQVDHKKNEDCMERLSKMLRSMENAHLQYLAEAFLIDEQLTKDLKNAPAGIKAHHAYQGGLLEHTVSLMEMAEMTAKHYDILDRDIMLIGSFLHDIGKIRELTYERSLGYSDEGQLLGHLVIGIQMLDKKIEEASKLANEKFPDQLAMLLKHIILSHHGSPEFGSPKVPMTFEAVAIRNLDELDAKIANFRTVIDSDVNNEDWTSYQPSLGRKIFKPKPGN